MRVIHKLVENLTLAILIAAIFPIPSHAQKNILVTIPPEKYFVEQIAGNLVNVSSIIPAGIDPHTYEPKPSDLMKLKKADLFIAVGTLEFERKWLPKFKKMFPGLRFISLFEGISLTNLKNKDLMAPEGFDPHIWLSPPLVVLESRVIYDNLCKLLKEQKTLEQKYKAWINRLITLDNILMHKLSNYKGNIFLSYHPAWRYFAKSYGLVQLSIEIDGKKPGPRRLAAIASKIKLNQISTIFVHTSSPPLVAKKLATTMKLEIEIINPLDYNWEENMKKVAELILKSFGKTD